jgi:hypothetical protein
MAAPKGSTYTPSRGPLAGQTFRAPPNARGETAAYNAYQNALARHYGQPSYSAYKTQQASPFYIVARERARSKGQSRSEAGATARRIVGTDRIPRSAKGTYAGTKGNPNRTGARMSQIIQDMYAEGLYETGEEFDESVMYE